ncbi:DUF4276 family protein [Methanomassiliicoccaceae archaeon COG_1]|nr:DUF4276 family protein [Methanomassiliicoccaceae archaeon COG_1]
MYCEGHTEKMFTEKLLRPFFGSRGIEANTILAGNGSSGRKGGIINYTQVKGDLSRICREHPHEYVTTMIDYSPVIRLPLEYGGPGTIYDIVCSKEAAIEKDIGAPNLMMNFELHEFEAYLYCNPDAYVGFGRKAPDKIRRIVGRVSCPEMINTGHNTLPSRRLDEIISRYTHTKLFNTDKILEKTTLDQILSKCPHFAYWLERVCRTCGRPRLRS